MHNKASLLNNYTCQSKLVNLKKQRKRFQILNLFYTSINNYANLIFPYRFKMGVIIGILAEKEEI
ncbi:hypothetical protein SN16_10945 [Salinicoccus roseus]|uniref:Uncharacterized protein n=1 Tax=Salinicoccus roseus TaxID=45670 RepID=A0A0C2E3K5_9STAP|nr:hypothetical protein SN16_10945 [Salinicoccus roseus]